MVAALDAAAFDADRARGVSRMSPLCVPTVATGAGGIDMSIATMPPATVLATHYQLVPWQVAVK